MDDAVLEVLLDIRDILQSPANEEKTDEVKEQHAEIGKSVDKDDIGEFVKITTNCTEGGNTMKNEEIKKIIKHYTSDSRYSRCPDKKCKNHNWETLFGIEDSTEINYCDLLW